MKNIIFLVDAQKGPSGGGKVIYQYSNYINSLENYSSSIIHLKKKRIKKVFDSLNKRLNNKFNKKKISGWNIKDLEIKKDHQFSWFNKKINSKNNFDFNKNKDFVILPEIFAHFAEDLLIKQKIPYGIFVQNGYTIFPTNDLAKLNKAYHKAKFILSYSKDIKDCILLAYPNVRKKMIDVICAIDAKKFNIKIKKQNLITFMPRKLRKHSELVSAFIKNNLPKKWKIKPIENLNEKEVYKILNKSKIFLSFSELEGLGIPPIEAALTGNKVIGYTGESGKEYWKQPIFTRVYSGDIKNFCKEILKNLETKHFIKKSKQQRKKLAEYYSLEKERYSIIKFLKYI